MTHPHLATLAPPVPEPAVSCDANVDRLCHIAQAAASLYALVEIPYPHGSTPGVPHFAGSIIQAGTYAEEYLAREGLFKCAVLPKGQAAEAREAARKLIEELERFVEGLDDGDTGTN